MNTFTAVMLIGLSASAPLQAASDGDWRRVLRLKPGSEIRLATRDRVVRDGHLGHADNDRVVVVFVSTLPSHARRALLDITTNHPGYIGQLPRFKHRDLLVDDAGIHFKGVRVSGVEEVIVAIPKDDVIELRRRARGSVVGGIVGAGLGLVAGLAIAWHSMWTGNEALFISGLVGGPVAGGYLGAKGMPYERWPLVYKRR
jgi:hypothetical protein